MKTLGRIVRDNRINSFNFGFEFGIPMRYLDAFPFPKRFSITKD